MQKTRAFTLVELAIVIVIAGILAAVAIPIYQGIVEKSKWTEGKTSVGSIHSALEVYRTEHSNDMTSYPDGAGVDWLDLDLDSTEYDGQHFWNTDYADDMVDAVNGQYTVEVSGPSGGAAQNPTSAGTYQIDQDGNVLIDAP